MESTCIHNNPVRLSIPRPQRSEQTLQPLIDLIRAVGGALVAANVTLGRRSSVAPGLSDRSIALIATGERVEDIARRSALAHQYGAARIML